MSRLRQIAALNMRGIEPAPIADHKPKFEWVDPAGLYVEEAYQRNLTEHSLTMIRKIVARWNWAHIKPAICVRDARGRLLVIDGQHTAIAAVSHGGVKSIPVMIVRAETVDDRAKAFISHNRDRLVVTPMQMHYAALAAGDEIAVAVDQACRKAGVTIMRSSRGIAGVYRVGETYAIGVISRVVARVGAHQSARMLKVLVDAKRAPIPAHEIAAVSILMFDRQYRDTFDLFDLVTVIRSKTVMEWRAKAAALSAKDNVPPRAAIATVWHKAVK